MIRQTTVSIGIPAFNEEGNIKGLLESLLKQKSTPQFTLEKIYVVSDGSTDQTQKEVTSVNNAKIIYKDDKKRLGKSARLEEIFRLNTSDVLILLDADVFMSDTQLFSKLLKAVDFDRCGIVAINAKPFASKTFFEEVLNTSVYTTKLIAQQWNKGDNYLSFKGCFLALSGKFVKNLHIPKKLINNDAYLYFAAKKAGFGATYVKNCTVYYKSPGTLVDHILQSSRFQLSKQELGKYFSQGELSYSPPIGIVFKSIIETILKKPLYFVSYVGVHLLSKIQKQNADKPAWNIADTTKQKFIPGN
jgi:glycosyltransferase involved in cell wall biosynthesis